MDDQMQVSQKTTGKPKRKASRFLVLVGAPLGFIAGLAYIFIYDPSRQTVLFVPCYFLEVTGFYCPGCGNTRALHELLHLHFLEAFDHNLIFPFIAVITLYLLVGEYLNVLLGRRVLWLPKKVPIWLLLLAGLFVVAFSILRNLPFGPFEWLAPGL